MPCIVSPPLVSENEWLSKMLFDAFHLLSTDNLLKVVDLIKDYSNTEQRLCTICQLLDIEQINRVKGIDIYIGLSQWYRQHLLTDYSNNYDDSEERKRIEKEADRCGWFVRKEQFGFSAGTKED